MNILIVSTFFPPQNAIASDRPSSWAKYWTKQGHNVEVLTIEKETPSINTGFQVHEIKPGKTFNQLKSIYRKNKATNNKNEASSAPGMLSKFKKLLVARGLTSSTRMPDPADFWAHNAIKWCKSNSKKWDIVISTFGPYATHSVAYYLKANNRANFWCMDFRDLWTDSHIFKGIPPFTLLESVLEKKYVDTANLITTVSDPLRDILRYKYYYKNIETIENGFDPSKLDSLSEENIFQDKNKFRILYSGTIYEGKRDPSPLFEAIANISKSSNSSILDNLELNFIGPNIDILNQLINKYGVQKYVQLLGMKEREVSLRMQRDSQILLFLEYEDPNIDGILTGKLFEYLNSGTYIWGIGISNQCSPGRVIEESKTGQSFKNDVAKIELELINVLKNKSAQYLADRDYIKQFDRENLAIKLLNHFPTKLI